MSSNLFILVEDGEIKTGPTLLPNVWKNISNFNSITDIDFLIENNWYPVEIVKINEGAPIFVDATYEILDKKVVLTQSFRDFTSTEITDQQEQEKINKQQELAYEAKRRLIETDSLVTGDVWDKLSQEEKNKISAYRQTLRDIPNIYTSLTDVIWPVM